jgi:sigma-B regulation protein RsbU (phosphoserine phosphatase)
LPTIPTLDLATHYQSSQRAGGDYYDFFPLPTGKWGIFIADVSGHGIPAAVLMAVTHCIAHTHPGPPQPPGKVLDYLNHHLASKYTHQNENFITAFYGVYDPADRTLTYACAGHNPPRLKRCQDGTLLALDRAGGYPLGITSEGAYDECVQQLQPGDQIIFYTDGITEASNPEGKLFGTDRLDQVLENCSLQASALLDSVLRSVEEFANGHQADDDRTLIVARVS